MTDNRGLLVNFVPVKHDKWTVSGIGEAKLSVAGQGDVNLHATVNGRTLSGIMRGVLYVPGLGINLYSIGTATDAGVEVLFSNNTVSFSRDGEVIMEGRRSGKEALYHLDIQAEELNTRTERVLVAAHVEPLSLWHQRLGHLNYKKVLKMASLGSVKGLALFNDLIHYSSSDTALYPTDEWSGRKIKQNHRRISKKPDVRESSPTRTLGASSPMRSLRPK
jgi:hypothetical protein